MVMTVIFDPSDGFTRVTLLPVFSVTHRKLSGPQMISHGSAKPVARTRKVNGTLEAGPAVGLFRDAVQPDTATKSRVAITKKRFTCCPLQRSTGPDLRRSIRISYPRRDLPPRIDGARVVEGSHTGLHRLLG